MNRRTFIQLSLAASTMAMFPAAASTTAGAPARPKRGLGLSTKDPLWRQKLQASHAGWFYSWGPVRPADTPPGVEFVPMVFGRMNDTRFAETAAALKQQGSTRLLGLNEPDEKHQGNVTVEAALELWPKLMALGLPLGSPGCVHPDREWMKAFMQGVKERSLRVDFVCVHSYGGPNANALMQRLETVRDLFQRPLWITEFAVGDWQAKARAQNRHSPERVHAFMEELLPRLDACEFVERYAWFPAQPTSAPLGSSALFNEDGSLTPLGEAYRRT